MQSVLIVDDNATNCEILEEMLAGKHQVHTAHGGPCALELATLHAPEIILVDAMMPDMDGYELCRRLRQLPEARNAHIVMVSAKAMAAERTRGFDAGANAYLAKPFDEKELNDAMVSHGRST